MSLTNRYDFVLLFDVKDGNPNGDPDAGNLPRMDAETGHGLVTDVSLKRKVRNFVGMAKGEQPPFEIYVKEKAILNNQHKRAYVGIGREELLAGDDKKRKGGDAVDDARQWMCRNFFDVRTFGAVMSTGINCGQVRGPVQITFARSIDPIIAQEHSITRMAVATEVEAEKQEGDNRTMGRKHIVPYGLYMAHGFVSSFLAKQTGFSDDDLELLWQALAQMFEHDRSAARGEMTTRGLYVFKHDLELGNAPAHALFERIRPKLKEGVSVPRNFSDYDVAIQDTNMHAGVTLLRKSC
ncbi:MAG: type I-C CRISPR-associated protein Cas7/Csd2 [Ferrovum myxofaciens]|uniref:type I-C CRISPR-associated protein Cas7/Csd2 n=1 Tax=Ferrovum myxofaciens TaxID=416213 RepID=UPI0023580315|nr:type I-C CRISPR-associated protein Cas7/Csd2 [Ferrovum myxofaciens]QKE41161.1 MAG: type I-C CRISPR-associated protein Cas7/Csd2 [Ferrovum myxofaciens]